MCDSVYVCVYGMCVHGKFLGLLRFYCNKYYFVRFKYITLFIFSLTERFFLLFSKLEMSIILLLLLLSSYRLSLILLLLLFNITDYY
jgi:hypothetical protein